jgi:hypothetical protein
VMGTKFFKRKGNSNEQSRYTFRAIRSL